MKKIRKPTTVLPLTTTGLVKLSVSTLLLGLSAVAPAAEMKIPLPDKLETAGWKLVGSSKVRENITANEGILRIQGGDDRTTLYFPLPQVRPNQQMTLSWQWRLTSKNSTPTDVTRSLSPIALTVGVWSTESMLDSPAKNWIGKALKSLSSRPSPDFELCYRWSEPSLDTLGQQRQSLQTLQLRDGSHMQNIWFAERRNVDRDFLTKFAKSMTGQRHLMISMDSANEQHPTMEVKDLRISINN